MTAPDVEAAFDKVPFKHLLFKMSRLNFADWSLLLASYFENRSCRVEIDDALLAPFTLQAGTPQDGLLSPFLFSVYTSDMPLKDTLPPRCKDKFRKVVSSFSLRQDASETLLKKWGHPSIF